MAELGAPGPVQVVEAVCVDAEEEEAQAACEVVADPEEAVTMPVWRVVVGLEAGAAEAEGL